MRVLNDAPILPAATFDSIELFISEGNIESGNFRILKSASATKTLAGVIGVSVERAIVANATQDTASGATLHSTSPRADKMLE